MYFVTSKIEKRAREHAGRSRYVSHLCATTALAFLAASSTVLAQATIEGGSTVTVPGSQASPWTVGGVLTVGNSGNGTLNIGATGVVDSAGGRIGESAGYSGTVTVSGSGATWTNNGLLPIGLGGSGTLTITNGGTVTSLDGYLGALAGGSGSVTVSGATSSWLVNGQIIVGNLGSGSLRVENGATVTSTTNFLGVTAGVTGSVLITGPGSSWAASALYVGYGGTGEITVADGGKLTSTTAGIAAQTGGTGEVTVTGAGSVWNSIDLKVGYGGRGTLSIADGGAVNTASGAIGFVTDSGKAIVSGAGSVWNVGQLYVGGDSFNSGVGDLVVSNGGTVTVGNGAGTIDVALLSTSSGRVVIGGEITSPGYNPPAAPGTLNVAAVNLATTLTSIAFNHTSSNYVFTPQIAGVGNINHLAGTTVLTADSSAFTGEAIVYGGRLVINGSLANGLVYAQDGGVLGGSGTVGGVVAKNGGIVAPGNSIGTLNVTGNVSFEPTSVYQVEVNAAGQSDKIVAGGTATITGGTVQVLAGTGSYAPATTYTILTAAGGRTGVFDTVTSNFAFLAPSLSYDPTSVYLTLTRNSVDFASVGITRNQIATGGGLEKFGFGNAVYDAAVQLSAPQARAAFDRLSGEAHASAKTVMIEDSRFVREAAIDRLRAAFADVGASSSPVMAYDTHGRPHAAAPTTSQLAVWAHGFGAWGRQNGDGNAARYDRSIGGFVAGTDGLALNTWRLGLLGGYSRTSFDVKDRASSGSSGNYHVGLYNGTQWGNLAFRSGFAYTWHDLSMTRSVAFPGFADQLKADTKAGTAQAFGELGYGMHVGRLAFEPFANLAYVSLKTDAFRETGGAAALSGADSRTGTTFTTLGLRASQDVAVGTMSGVIRGTIGWRHAFAETPLSVVSFAGGSSFVVAGVPIARHAAIIEGGFDLDLSRTTTLGLSYGGQFASGAVDQTVRANFNVKF